VKLDAAGEQLQADPTPAAERTKVVDYFEAIKNDVARVVGSNELSRGGSIRTRLETIPARPGEKPTTIRLDGQTRAVLKRAAVVRELNEKAYDGVFNNLYDGKPPREAVKAEFRKLREEVLLLYGSGELPARNVANIGYLLYADHLLAVELAGTLLLVATIGAVAIAHRKGAVQ
jgi:hypothetical protein